MVLFAVGFCFSLAGISLLYTKSQTDQKISDVWLILITLHAIGTFLMLVASLCGSCSLCVHFSCLDNKVETDSEDKPEVIKQAWEIETE